MISTKTFTGEFPRVLPYLAPPNAAQYALDCDFSAGSLRGIRDNGPTAVSGGSGVRSLYVHDNGAIYSWPSDVMAFRGPIANDAFDRFYFLENGTLYVAQAGAGGGTPSQRYQVGVPVPQEPIEVVDKFEVDVLPTVSITVLVEAAANDVVEEITSFSVQHIDKTRQRWSFVLSGFPKPLSEYLTRTKTVSKVRDVPLTTMDDNGVHIATTTSESYDEDVSEVVGTFAVRIDVGGSVGILRANPAQAQVHPAFTAYITLDKFAIGGVFEINPASPYVEVRSYAYTYVNQFGEESAPSAPMGTDTTIIHPVDMKIPPAPTGHGYAPIEKIRLYRTNTGSNSTDYLFAGELPAAGGDHNDPASVAGLGEPLATRGYYPPETGLQNMIALPNGIFATTKDNEIYFSEPYLPYAWRPDNTMTTLSDIVGMCAAEGGVYITTKSNPYFISGMTPDAMSQTKITSVQAGVAKRAICNLGFAVAYASNDGICMARGVDVSMDWSFKFFTREDWRDRYAGKLSQMRLDAHDGNLLVWFEDGSPGFLIRFDAEDPSMTQLSDGYFASFVYPQGDALYLATGSSIVEFKGASSRSPFVWWSKDFIGNKPINYGAIQFVGMGTISVECFADGASYHAKSGINLTDTGSAVIRMPSGKMARRWSFKLTGGSTAEIFEYNVAVSPKEFQGV